MPKQKTHSSSKKRYKVTGTGKILRSQAFRRHILSKRPTKRMRHLRGSLVVSQADVKVIRQLIPYK